MPRWLRAAIKKGKKREDFLIAKLFVSKRLTSAYRATVSALGRMS
jgi:hypothetical protein